ncbi:MAG TPA: hypothetical protein VIR98_01960 [Candidatus Paceibacterota bacterium]
MKSSGKDEELQRKFAAQVLSELKRIKPHLAQISVFKTPEIFYHRQYGGKGAKVGIVVFADGIKFVVRPDLIMSSIVSGENIFRISYLRQTSEIKRRMVEAGDRASFSREVLLTQSGRLLESYVQYMNLGLCDENSGLTTINATHFEVKIIDVETFDWTQPVHFGPASPTVGANTLDNLKKLSEQRF